MIPTTRLLIMNQLLQTFYQRLINDFIVQRQTLFFQIIYNVTSSIYFTQSCQGLLDLQVVNFNEGIIKRALASKEL